MYYLRELEGRIHEYRRHEELELAPEDRDVLESIQQEESAGLKARVATALVKLGFKVDAEAALATSHEAA